MENPTPLATQDQAAPNAAEQSLEGGAYEVIRKRLLTLSSDLLTRLDKLNQRRKEVFGALESQVLRSDRIVTRNNCVPRDLVTIGNTLIFGYNVFIGLKKEISVNDVLSAYALKDDRFEELEAFPPFENPQFVKDFQDMYNYYKQTRFMQFYRKEATLLMVFQTGKNSSDVKVFKWLFENDGTLTYVHNRAERELSFPAQQDFEWRGTGREHFVYGKHPHVSIADRVFVETVGGDLTIKVENNTASGAGIYTEPVQHALQKLEDGQIYYALLGSLILLKILPYQEEQFRYLIFDEKRQQAVRVDEIAFAAVRLPEDDGLIFPGGYFLMNEGYKSFNLDTAGMKFVKRLQSPNGEDYMYVFYREESGEYVLLQYNLINKTVAAPMACHGFAIYDDGKMVFFKAGEEAQRSHAIQIWQTPFVSDLFLTAVDNNTYMARIGNRDIVRGLADARAIYNLIRAEQVYLGLYHEVVRKVTSLLDLYYWLDSPEVFAPRDVLIEIQATAKAAIDEYDKVVQIRKNAAETLQKAETSTAELLSEIVTITFDRVDKYVGLLNRLHLKRGEIISLKDLRYVDVARVDALEQSVKAEYERCSQNCVGFLLRDDALRPFEQQLQAIETRLPALAKTVELNDVGQELTQVNASLDLLTELVNTLKIEDAAQTAQIIERLSALYARVNQLKAVFEKHRRALRAQEVQLEFTAQFKLINQTVANFLDQATTPPKCEDMQTRVMIQLEELEGRFADFDEYIEKLTAKREEVYSAFNTKKIQLEEALNKQTTRLQSSAARILNGIANRLATLKSVAEMNGYFASDRMVLKVRELVDELLKLGDSVKAEDLASRLKSLQQEGVRQLKDQLDLYAGGGDLITLGNFKFTVNRQVFGLTTVQRDGRMYFHLTGTEFFEAITDAAFQATQGFWNQDLVSETDQIYRAEYLAYKFLLARPRELAALVNQPAQLAAAVREFMTPFFLR